MNNKNKTEYSILISAVILLLFFIRDTVSVDIVILKYVILENIGHFMRTKAMKKNT